MTDKTHLGIEFKFSDDNFGDIVPWTTIYKTSDIDDLTWVYKTLTNGNLPGHYYRCYILISGKYRPISL